MEWQKVGPSYWQLGRKVRGAVREPIATAMSDDRGRWVWCVWVAGTEHRGQSDERWHAMKAIEDLLGIAVDPTLTHDEAKAALDKVLGEVPHVGKVISKALREAFAAELEEALRLQGAA